MDSVTLCERLFAPSENVSVKMNTTVDANIVFNNKKKKHLNKAS